MEVRTVEVHISPGEIIRVEGLQRDRRMRNDLRILLPDGRVVLAHGRRPTEEGWEVYFDDQSEVIGGTDLGTSLMYLMGYEPWVDEPPDWLDHFMDAVR
jgi:hypothetical protein